MSLTIWNESTREELSTKLPDALVVLPTAATEQHGPHLVTGHDTFMVTHIARQAAERASESRDIVLAPSLAFGSSAHHLEFGGTLSLGTETYLLVVRDLIESILECGARRVMLLNGHGGNHELNQLAVRDIAVELPPEPRVVVSAASYWDIARSAVAADERFADMGLPGHAGHFETATMLALAPERVRERAERSTDPSDTGGVPGVRIEASDRWEMFDGYTDFPHRATPDEGERLLEIVTDAVADAFVALASS